MQYFTQLHFADLQLQCPARYTEKGVRRVGECDLQAAFAITWRAEGLPIQELFYRFRAIERGIDKLDFPRKKAFDGIGQ